MLNCEIAYLLQLEDETSNKPPRRKEVENGDMIKTLLAAKLVERRTRKEGGEEDYVLSEAGKSFTSALRSLNSFESLFRNKKDLHVSKVTAALIYLLLQTTNDSRYHLEVPLTRFKEQTATGWELFIQAVNKVDNNGK